ncbi:hypothetical protein GIB67_008948 [Kingdonia uniflora]|uniref:Pentatricopeptide repeat-containing protein n=1 Tax=Kingdonia uniflora TaxID=39325 RepID=A0A7J7LVS5_9MAGN|nr:hypothetical protein GIB67_008948 [Kingdonia uniflora]
MKGKGRAAGNYFMLNTGAKIPVIGLGTWQSGGDLCIEAVKTALDALFLSFVYCLRLCRIPRFFMGYALKIGFESDVFVSGALVNSYSKFGRVEDARRLFDGMDERDVILWNVMLKADMELGNEDEMYRLFSEFHRSGLLPDDSSVHCVFSGSSSN